MSSVLRIALAAFAIVPLQRALNLIGAALALPALLWAVLRPASAPIAVFFMFMGMLLIVLTPFLGGGAALRYASSSSLLHLRPYGRLRMLLGAALAITFVAALIALPMFVLEWLQPPGARLPVPGGTLFPVMWLCTVLVWIGMFGILGARRSMLPLTFVVPIAAGPIVGYIGTSSMGVMIFAVTALAAMVAFPVWYARTDKVRRPGMDADTSPWSPGVAWQGLGLESQSLPSRAVVLRQYLLGTSLAGLAVSGVILVGFLLLIVLLPRFTASRASGPNPFIVLILAPLGIMVATAGHMNARRARLLWLRAGLDRAALFSVAAREGLISSALTYGIPVAALVGVGIFMQPALAAQHLAYGLVSLAAALCFFHAGLSTVGNWDAADIVLMSCMVALQVVITVLTHPGAKDCIPWALGFTAGLAVLTLILRTYARRRWPLLDWRVMRMLQTRR